MEIFSPLGNSCAKGLKKVEESSQSNLTAGAPLIELVALREAMRKGTWASWRNLAMRVEVLPVPPVRRMAIATRGYKNV